MQREKKKRKKRIRYGNEIRWKKEERKKKLKNQGKYLNYTRNFFEGLKVKKVKKKYSGEQYQLTSLLRKQPRRLL